MNQSVLYTNNLNNSTIISGNAIPLGEIRRRTGNQLNLTTSGITITGRGYFKIDFMTVIVPGTAGAYTVSAYLDGEPIAGATATVYGAEDAATIATVPAVIRKRTCDTSVLTLRYEGATSVVNNVSVVAERV